MSRIPGKYAIAEGCCRKIQNGPSMVFRLGTLNVGSLTGRSTKIAEMLERRRICIYCLQEIEWCFVQLKNTEADIKRNKFNQFCRNDRFDLIYSLVYTIFDLLFENQYKNEKTEKKEKILKIQEFVEMLKKGKKKEKVNIRLMKKNCEITEDRENPDKLYNKKNEEINDIALWPASLSDSFIDYILKNKPENIGNIENLKSVFKEKDDVYYSRGLSNDHFYRKKSNGVLEKRTWLVFSEKMNKYETALMTVIWNCILQRKNSTSKSLQSIECELFKGSMLLKSLDSFIENFRNDYEKVMTEATDLSGLQSFSEEDEVTFNRRKRNAFFDENNEEYKFTTRDNFKINTFYVICDSIKTLLLQRVQKYEVVLEHFRIFLNWNLSEERIEKYLQK
ncbi:hypothetical protein HELRODRAFT_165006 [Helobdella robusta]|uniref:Uncharacterized protein n=1 Tax=Helobdella robusta TaxID=6412 RepID=T1EW41_HELRO|nr:hypothetical protein HELRODRAFT_165006 [Helobdella robusta]ESN92873.1 hypothetical protein HELRODRAFT_165006 [Helobdella robusta]